MCMRVVSVHVSVHVHVHVHVSVHVHVHMCERGERQGRGLRSSYELVWRPCRPNIGNCALRFFYFRGAPISQAMHGQNELVMKIPAAFFSSKILKPFPNLMKNKKNLPVKKRIFAKWKSLLALRKAQLP